MDENIKLTVLRSFEEFDEVEVGHDADPLAVITVTATTKILSVDAHFYRISVSDQCNGHTHTQIDQCNNQNNTWKTTDASAFMCTVKSRYLSRGILERHLFFTSQ